MKFKVRPEHECLLAEVECIKSKNEHYWFKIYQHNVTKKLKAVFFAEDAPKEKLGLHIDEVNELREQAIKAFVDFLWVGK